MTNVKKFNVNEEGLNRFFGPLEAKIMNILWLSDGMSIKDVQSILNQESPISFNTVMTVMNRLLEKGHLSKDTRGKGRNRVTVFEPVQTKEQFLHVQTKAVTDGLIQEFGDLVVGHMIDALEDADSELINKLSDKLNQLKSRKDL
ncbi:MULTISPECIES: BlaI/MecI/CopY family transcriptional regulator [Paenibacillaceae]|uniref:BlaI/MecI/CopY family transcriptional regulator n=1 Tax=Marinicrinis lubricantis TaxID=2086470 RepID=A0ABW1IU04_9BACL|nr:MULTISPECIES: BlaI/MecI/CopY family transcriptional regulator [Paenibacillus]MED4599709.1 BlaI/MecI/CopY family transcriptional regulator [Paenibacillus validus]MED4604858.1 BlaI/MecI/CopY family transcriptional regulator [Paenibacillus validus]NTZ19072.1 BlaI/MecI/CopY family transcriptional regulator [Paenibacillus sp. JMULE4]